MIGSLRFKEAETIKAIFPEIFKIIYHTLENNFPLDVLYAPKLLEQEASEILISLIASGLVDYDPIWSCYNEHAACVFVEEFVSWNKNLNGYTAPSDLVAVDIFHTPQRK